MATAPLSFDEEFLPQIRATLDTGVDDIQKKMNEIRFASVDEAEKKLDEACDDWVRTAQSKIEEIRAAVKTAKPNQSSSTYDQDIKKYQMYLEATTAGIETSKNLLMTVFERIRNIVSMVINCVKAGVTHIWNQLTEAFAAIRSIWKS